MRNISDKNSKEPNALSGFRGIETLSQIIPIFFQSFPLVFAVRDFDIPDAISCSRNDGINAKSSPLVFCKIRTRAVFTETLLL